MIVVFIILCLAVTTYTMYLEMKQKQRLLGELAPIGTIDLHDLKGRARNCGAIAVSFPKNIQLGHRINVYLAISTICDGEEIIGDIKETYNGRMKATLVGQGLNILAEAPEIQAVKKYAVTRWSWSITPDKEGSYNLALALSHIIKIDGADAPYMYRQFRNNLLIEAKLKKRIVTFWKNYWQWIIGALAALVVTTAKVWWFFKSRKI